MKKASPSVHLSNIYDHRIRDARVVFGLPDDTAEREILGIKIPRHRTWEEHLAWINLNVIGPPLQTPYLSRRKLEDTQNMIGIYEPAG